MSCLLSYYNTVPFPLQSNLRSVFCTFCIPHLFQLLKNLGCSCAGSSFSLLKCTISTPDCAEFALFLLKCTISPWNYAKQKIFLGISSRQSAALVISHFPQAHTPHPCEVFLLYKRSLSFKTNKKETRSQASSPAAGRLISPILFQPMAILAERFYGRVKK